MPPPLFSLLVPPPPPAWLHIHLSANRKIHLIISGHGLVQ